ncbi:MAG: hypothetical protein AAF846_11635 [Chloroflexota bacterium]
MSTVKANKNDNLTIEERLQPWLDQAEYLIFFVIGVMVWSAIFVNLAGVLAIRLSEGDPLPMRAVFGLAFVIPTFAFWLYPIFSLKGLDRARRGLGFIQRNPWTLILIYGVFLFLMVSTIQRRIWSPYSLIEVCILILLVMFTLVVLFIQPSKDAPFQMWRKVFMGLIALYFVVEAVLYGLLFAGVITVEGDAGLGVAYGRLINQDETMTISQSNQYGWHYPNFRMEEDSYRILLHGDSFVQALQIPSSEHFGVKLDALLNAEEAEPSYEVMAQGMPGYGPSMYLNDNMSSYIWQPLEPNETIVFFHLLNDFQIETALDDRISYSYLTGNPDDRAFVSDDVIRAYHPNSHIVIGGHDPADPYRTIMSYSMVWNLIDSAQGGRILEQPLHMDEVSADAPFASVSVLYDTTAVSEVADNTYAITEAILADYVDAMADIGVTVRLVTIPYFPAQFYDAKTGTDWTPTLGNYDLTLPEEEMRAMANSLGIEFLGMVNYLQGTDIARLQSYFFEDGTGHLTETGHQVFAEAVYNCFYTETSDARCGN